MDHCYHGRHIEKILKDAPSLNGAFADETFGGVGNILGGGFGKDLDHIHFVSDGSQRKRISRKECVSLVGQRLPTVGWRNRLFIDNGVMCGFVVGYLKYGGVYAIDPRLATCTQYMYYDKSTKQNVSIAYYTESNNAVTGISRQQFSEIVSSFKDIEGMWLAGTLRHAGMID